MPDQLPEKPPAASPMLTEHPALQRFLSLHPHGGKLLVISAASGTGRSLFARGWLGKRPGEIIDLSAPGTNLAPALDNITERIENEPERYFAVLVPPALSTWLMSARLTGLLAQHRDLLLTHSELRSVLACDAETSQKIFEQCGGWLSAARLLHASPENTSGAFQAIRSGLYRWLTPHPHAEPIRQSSFLPVVDENVMAAFYDHAGHVAFGFEDLLDNGILQEDHDGQWIMPDLIRRALSEQQRMMDPETAQKLEMLALQTVATTHSIQKAVDSALTRRNWRALDHIISERWVDMFFANPRGLRRYLSRLPEFVIDQTGFLWIAIRLVTTIGTDRMVGNFPTIAPNYEADQAAQRLEEQLIKAYRRPNTRSISAGVVQISYLRWVGHYKHAAQAAITLRQVTQTAITTKRISPKLLCMVEHQCGISLELAGQDSKAKWAFTAAYHAAEDAESPFLIADATGRLALLSVKQNDHRAARRWLAEHDKHIAKVGWGQAMVGRGAVLARAHLALSSLDIPLFEEELAKIPAEPDVDEYWGMHTALLAFHAVLRGKIPEFSQVLDRLLTERTYALPEMTAELVAQAQQVLLLAGHGQDPAPTQGQHAAEFRALVALREGQIDQALTLLEEGNARPLSHRCSGLELYLGMAARHPLGPSTQDISALKALHGAQGHLLDLALLCLAPGWDRAMEKLELDPESVRRIRSLQQVFPAPTVVPELTDRELELLRLLREGLSRKQIATSTFRSENTIKTQLRGLYRKLDAVDGVMALERARSLGL